MTKVIIVDGKEIPVEIEINRHVRFTTADIRVGYSLKWQNIDLSAIVDFSADFIKDYGEKEAIWIPIRQQFTDKRKLNLMAQRSVHDALLRIGHNLTEAGKRINTTLEMSSDDIEDVVIDIESAASSLNKLSEWRAEDE